VHGQLAQHLRSSQPKGHPPTPRGTWGNFGEIRGEKWCWSTKAAIGLSLKRVEIEEKLDGEPIRTHQRPFERYHP